MRNRTWLAALALLTACSDDPSAGREDEGEGPDPDAASDADVVAYEYTATLQPGEDVDQCRFVKAPADGMFVNRAELALSPGNHHTILYTTSYGEIPTVDLHGATRDTSGLMDCHNFKHLDWDLRGYLVMGQSSESSDAFDLPDGVGLKVEPGAVLLYSVHTINTGDAPLEVANKVTLHTLPPAEVEQEAGTLYFYNLFIDVPARSAASARQVCPVPRDVTIASLQGHTHRFGTGSVATLVDGDGAPLEELYRNQRAWDQAHVEDFGGGKVLPAGSRIDVQCDYMNTGDVDVAQGPLATDEMCALIGVYYPVDEQFGKCSYEDSFLTQSSAAMQIGDGAATCLETLTCLGQARPFLEDAGRSMAPCFRDSCPAAAPVIDDAVKCVAALAPGADPQVACGAELASCAQSTCE